MKARIKRDEEERLTDPSREKRPYQQPFLQCYGSLRTLTKSGTSSSTEQTTMNGCSADNRMSCLSDRIEKEHIVRIDTHPLGIGLYLFDYKSEFRNVWGHGRQFGVMADEVEKVMPEAVSVHPDGYKMVDYGMLGISRALH